MRAQQVGRRGVRVFWEQLIGDFRHPLRGPLDHRFPTFRIGAHCARKRERRTVSRFALGRLFGIDVDPVDGETFWGTAMTVSATGWWETHIVPFTVSKTWPVAPAAYNWVRGGWQSGGVASLMFDDGDYNVAKAGLVLFPNEPPAQIVVDSVAPVGQVLGLSVSIVAKVNTPGLSQRVELWNWTTGAYVSVGTTGSTVSDSIQTATASGALAEYVQAGTRAVRAKVSFFRTGLTFVFPWAFLSRSSRVEDQGAVNSNIVRRPQAFHTPSRRM